MHLSMDRTTPVRAFLVALMVGGCLVLWIGAPVGALWVASTLTDSPATHFVIGLPMVLASMAVFARALFWVNRLYVRATFGRAAVEQNEDDEWTPRWIHGPLEPLLVCTLALAIALMCVWFFFLAENPGPATPI